MYSNHLLFFLLFCLTIACQNQAQSDTRTYPELTKEAKAYWFSGEAELASYKLEQARYGEMREGSAVMVFVSEPFSTQSWSKSSDGEASLKLNFTKKFTTGVYPYSLMMSTFFPISKGDHSLMLSMSMQEWCGQSYLALRNKEQFELQVHSYFKGESVDKKMEQTYLEDDIWTMIRLRPEALLEGKHELVPAFFYMTLKHVEMKAYEAVLKKEQANKKEMIYSINYTQLNRSLSIRYEKDFPHRIISWEETYNDGGQLLTTKGTLIKTLKSAYWNRSRNADARLRKELGLEE